MLSGLSLSLTGWSNSSCCPPSRARLPRSAGSAWQGRAQARGGSPEGSPVGPPVGPPVGWPVGWPALAQTPFVSFSAPREDQKPEISGAPPLTQPFELQWLVRFSLPASINMVCLKHLRTLAGPIKMRVVASREIHLTATHFVTGLWRLQDRGGRGAGPNGRRGPRRRAGGQRGELLLAPWRSPQNKSSTIACS